MTQPRRPDGDEAFCPAERQALDAWDVPPPANDLTNKVLSRMRRRRLRRLVAVSSAAAVLLLSSIALISLRRTDSRGEHSAQNRTTLKLADRAIAVAEAGSHIVWHVSRDRSARITQRSGNVFYRVEPGGSFVVSTPQGTVHVIGTCFRVEVRRANVRVSVYEGKVRSAAPDDEGNGTEVPAGKVALMDGDTPTIVGDVTRAMDGDPTARSNKGGGTGLSEDVHRKNEQLVKRSRLLEAEVEELRAQLQQVSGKAKQTKFLDLSKEDKVELAKKCELRWDIPYYGSDAPTVSPKDKDKIGLTDAERKMVNQVLAEQHAAMQTALQKLYVEVTGDSKGVESLSPSAMMSEIMDKSPQSETRLVYQRLARERAGLQAPPSNIAAGSPLERLMRLLTTAGDRTEKAVGARVGPDLARRHRQLHGGYGSKSRSAHGCPDK